MYADANNCFVPLFVSNWNNCVWWVGAL